MATKASGKKCPFCGQVHPSSVKFCPKSGQNLYISCSNPDCKHYEKEDVPVGSDYCPACGTRLWSIIKKKEATKNVSANACPYCGGSHPMSAKFCTNTGKRLLVTCPNESCPNHHIESIRIGTLYCPECGTKIKEKAPSPDGKRGCFRAFSIIFVTLLVIFLLIMIISALS